MPVSASQHRATTGTHQNKPFENNKRSNITHTSVINRDSQNVQRDQYDFPLALTHVGNSPDAMSKPTEQLTLRQSTARLCLQLLSQIRPGDNPLSAASGNSAMDSGRDVIPSFSRNAPHSDNSGNGFSTILSPVANALYEIGQFKAWHDPLRFPAADASRIPLAGTESTMAAAIAQDLNSDSYIITGEQKKNELISSLVQYLVSDGQMTADEGKDVELWLRSEAAGMPMVAARLDKEKSGTNRMKRIAVAESEAGIKKHIEEHCAFEEEVLNARGDNEGKLLLFQAQRAENPFRMIYDNTDGAPPPETRGVANGLNIVADILTLGIKPAIGTIIADAKRNAFYKGDKICQGRFKRKLVGDVATSINVDGLAFTPRGSARKVIPSELLHALPEQERAAYYTRNPHSGIRQEILLELKQGKRVINDNEASYHLKPTERKNEFIVSPSNAVRPELLERRVFFDEKNRSWNYADSFDSSGLNVEISEGKRQIKLHGEHYELQQNAAGKYEIVVNKESGVKEFIPVYMEPLSRTWHLSTHNGHPAFSKHQADLIRKIKIKKEDGFSYTPTETINKKYYGNGKIYVQEKIGDTSHYTWGRSVEMNGELVPVKTIVTRGHGVHHEVYNPLKPAGESYPIEFDGERWLFERKTSVHVSHGLKERVTPDMYDRNTDASKLSAPDHQGLRWDEKENTFLKVNRNFVKVKKMNGNRFSLAVPGRGNRRIVLRFKKNKFKIETTRERLKNILETGLGGRKRKTAISVLKEQDGFTEDSARELLARYQFPENGVYSDYSFAIDVEQLGAIPPWAERFRKRPRMDGSREEVIETVLLMKPDFPQHKVKFHLGEEIGDGAFGDVFLDADEQNYVIKKYHVDKIANPVEAATHEAEMFNRYYGESAAMVFLDEDRNVYIRMYKVPGQTLDSLPPNSLPPDAVERFVDMIEKLNKLGIIHNDIHSGNIIWDKESKLFYPIDIKNTREEYFNAVQDDKIDMNETGEDEWYTMLEEIEHKQFPANP